MNIILNKKTIVIIFLIMISITSLYYAYKKTRINRPLSAKLVFNIEETNLLSIYKR